MLLAANLSALGRLGQGDRRFRQIPSLTLAATGAGDALGSARSQL